MSQHSNFSKSQLAAIMVVYLLGVFMGSVDMGIVMPARTVIQSSFGVDANLGIWIVTIYSLAYAASIPVTGKLADRYGRKVVFLTCIFIFGLGSLLCGLSQYSDNFYVLLVCRAFQAIGGGGIVPIANAEFGTTFPPEKRGMALGMVGGVYGIANVVGSAFGSAIIDIFGQNCWSYIFYFNVPIAVVILVMGIKCLPNNKNEVTTKIDILGSLLFVVIILSLLYGLRMLDFFDFAVSITSTSVWPFLTLSVVLWPLFVFVEHRAEDPILNLSYFGNLNICLVLVMSIFTGVIMMGLLFVPQYSENSLFMASGSGGYFVLIIGLMSGMGSPMAGKLIDKYGSKFVIGMGFAISAAGALFLALVTSAFPNAFTIVVGLLLAGTGMGFVMGTPLNYMMLENVDAKESNSALATLSLVRSFGTIVAPAVLAGLIAHAGMAFQDNITDYLPEEVGGTMTQMTQMVKSNDSSGDEGDSDETFQIPAKALERLQNADVTTITEDVVYTVELMFDEMQDSAPAEMTGTLDSMEEEYVSMIRESAPQLEAGFQESLNTGFMQIYLAVGICAIIGLVLLIPYRSRTKEEHSEKTTRE